MSLTFLWYRRLKLLEGYHATLNGSQHVWIDEVDLTAWVMRGVQSEPASGMRLADQPYEISLHKIKGIAV